MEKKFIKDLTVNEQVNSVFVLRKKELKLTKYDKPYLQIRLSDSSGTIEARLWDNAEKFNEAAETGDVVKVIATVDKYREEKQLKIDDLEKADDREYRFEDMVRVAENRDRIYENILGYLYGIRNSWIKSLKDAFVGDDALMSDFIEGIGGKMWHNAYIGGLAEHTWEVIKIVDTMSELYPRADRDVLIFGAFIHDIGKVYELDPRKMEYTVRGGLVGHIVIGHKILMDKITSIEGFPEDLQLRLEHIILSHHGEYEQQSPVLPKTLEATIIYQADELVSQANAIQEIRRAQEADGKDWSSYVGIKNRKYYIKKDSEEEWKQESGSGADPGKADDLFS
jgi:3'-5' exoribonuclease